MTAKKWWQSRTLWVGVIEIAIAVLTYLAELPPSTTMTAGAAGILTIILRVITKQPIGR